MSKYSSIHVMSGKSISPYSGLRIEVTGAGDLGVDLTGIDPNGLRVIVQCKRYGRGQKVGSLVIQTLMGAVVNHGVDRGVFVTTSTYTAPAVSPGLDEYGNSVRGIKVREDLSENLGVHVFADEATDALLGPLGAYTSIA